MYKILIIYNDKVEKIKYYETEENFYYWLENHSKHYKSYKIIGYKLKSLNPNKWEQKS